MRPNSLVSDDVFDVQQSETFDLWDDASLHAASIFEIIIAD